jgi:carboxylate-amine ligase
VPTPEELREAFERPAQGMIGVEEELMVLDPETLDLAPRAEELLGALEGDARFKPELVAAQVEQITEPVSTVAEAAAELRDGRRALTAAAGSGLVLAAAGAHPFTAESGVLNTAERYRHTREEYAWVARRQLVFGLHIHVHVRGAERAVAIYNGMRSYLPELAALAANAPFYAGRDTGLASIRPKLSELLPRQGVPPAFARIEELGEALAWNASAGAGAEPRTWWWELRLHPVHGTVEVRVPDQQTTVDETAAVAAVAHSLVSYLAARYDEGDPAPVHPTWRIEENRWSACRHGMSGTLADLHTGERKPTRERLGVLLSELQAAAERLGCSSELDRAGDLIQKNGAEQQREVAQAGGATAVARWLSERFDA